MAGYDVISVHLTLADGSSIANFDFDAREMIDAAELAVAEIGRQAALALPGLWVKRLAYLDDENDRCTLTKETLQDAMSFATPLLNLEFKELNFGKLSVVVVTETDKVEVEAPTLESTKTVELHRNCVCDGCEAGPIMGPRYKSLKHEDFDLCEQCFAQSDRNPRNWVRVASVACAEAKPAATKGAPVEVHIRIACDGCDTSPIVGLRYKDLERDMDFCERCFRERREEGLHWCCVHSSSAVNAAHAPPYSGPRVLEVHENTSCAGCSTSPIVGAGFKKDEADNVTVCERCFAHWSQHGSWSRVFSSTTADVVATYLGAAGGETRMVDARTLVVPIHQAEPRDVTQLVEGCEAPDVPQFSSVKERDMMPQSDARQTPQTPPDGTIRASEKGSRLLDPVVCETALLALLADADGGVRRAARKALAAARGTEAEVVEWDWSCSEEFATSSTSSPAQEKVAQAEAETVPAEVQVSKASAVVVHSEDLMLGVEAWEHEESRGDVTREFAELLERTGARQAFRVGRVELRAGGSDDTPVMCSVSLLNNGQDLWPQTQFRCIRGEAYGVSSQPLSVLSPGQVEDVSLDFLLPPQPATTTTLSAWLHQDTCGLPLGPLLLLEVVFT